MDTIKEFVQQKYGEAALQARSGAKADADAGRPVDQTLLRRISTTTRRRRAYPRRPCSPRSGCGNPTALAELKAGEVVLDLGSGGGIDVLLSAKRVGRPEKRMAWT